MSAQAARQEHSKTAFAVVPALLTTIPVEGSAKLFPVRLIYCVGRNYAAHAVERRHLAGCRRRAAPGRRPQPADLEDAGNHRLPLGTVHPGAGRPDLFRNAGGRRRGRARPDLRVHIDGVGDLEVRVV
jgi:hypothetical protein